MNVAQPSSSTVEGVNASRRAWLMWGLGCPRTQSRCCTGPRWASPARRAGAVRGLAARCSAFHGLSSSRLRRDAGAGRRAARPVRLPPDGQGGARHGGRAGGARHRLRVRLRRAARVLVGAGDAMTFISVLRLVPSGSRPGACRSSPSSPACSASSARSRRRSRWSPCCTPPAGPRVPRRRRPGLVVALLALAGVRDAPPGTAPPPRPASEARHLAAAWRDPGTRLGLWTHFTTQFTGTVFGLLWGFPFLVGRGPAPTGRPAADPARARRRGRRAVSADPRPLAAPPLRARARDRRGQRGGLASCCLARAGTARAARACSLLVLATNGPGSMVGFDYARTDNPSPPAR